MFTKNMELVAKYLGKSKLPVEFYAHNNIIHIVGARVDESNIGTISITDNGYYLVVERYKCYRNYTDTDSLYAGIKILFDG